MNGDALDLKGNAYFQSVSDFVAIYIEDWAADQIGNLRDLRRKWLSRRRNTGLMIVGRAPIILTGSVETHNCCQQRNYPDIVFKYMISKTNHRHHFRA
jgi:hypothetical protein